MRCVANEGTGNTAEQQHNSYPMVTKWVVDGRLSMTEGKAYLDGFELGTHGYADE